MTRGILNCLAGAVFLAASYRREFSLPGVDTGPVLAGLGFLFVLLGFHRLARAKDDE